MDLTILQKGMCQLEKELQSGTEKNEGPFKVVMQAFYETASVQLQNLSISFKEAMDKFKFILEFFGEDPTVEIDAFFGNFFRFLLGFQRAREENQKRKATEKKAAEAAEKARLRQLQRKEKDKSNQNQPSGAMDQLIDHIRTGKAFKKDDPSSQETLDKFSNVNQSIRASRTNTPTSSSASSPYLIDSTNLPFRSNSLSRDSRLSPKPFSKSPRVEIPLRNIRVASAKQRLSGSSGSKSPTTHSMPSSPSVKSTLNQNQVISQYATIRPSKVNSDCRNSPNLRSPSLKSKLQRDTHRKSPGIKTGYTSSPFSGKQKSPQMNSTSSSSNNSDKFENRTENIGLQETINNLIANNFITSNSNTTSININITVNNNVK